MTYDVLLRKKDDKFIAQICQWPAIVVEGNTEEEALCKIKTSMQSLLTRSRIVQVEIDIKPDQHPWQQFAGMFADDRDWEAFQASIREYREEIDRDPHVVVDIDRTRLVRRMEHYFDPTISHEAMRHIAPGVMQNTARFNA